MAGKKRRSTAALGNAKGKSAKGVQADIMTNLLPMFKKPYDKKGETVKVPGKHWGTTCRAGDKEKMYVCVIKDFTNAHKENPGAVPSAAFLLAELGEDGHTPGSVDFWMKYPNPFLTYWYDTYPELLEEAINPASKAGSAGAAPTAGDEGAQGAAGVTRVEETAEESEKEKERRTQVLKYLNLKSEGRLVHGKQRGRMRRIYECTIIENGKKCCSPVTMYGFSTGSFFKHPSKHTARVT